MFYTTTDVFWVGKVAESAARTRGLTLTFVPEARICDRPPDWLITVPTQDEDFTPTEMSAGPRACRTHFVLSERVATNPLSGMPWMIYRRVPDATAAMKPVLP